jgi:uncharacterized protein (TIGR03435 family)
MRLKPQLDVVELIALAATVILSTLLNAQATTDTAWSSGSHPMAFDVASIRPSDSQVRANFGLSIDDTSIPPGGHLSANFSLKTYIEFAYKVMPTKEQEQSMLAHLADWVGVDNYTIEARADGNPTKDQMRLMMQSLLAERFKLAVHFETHESPVLALVLVKVGRLGPRLRLHAEGLSCEAKWTLPPDRSSPSVPPGGFLPSCGTTQAISGPNNTVIMGARDITLSHIASYLSSVRDFGRPVVDQTGLSGTFDFSLNWALEPTSTMSLSTGVQSDAGGPDLTEALRDQLGLKLLSEKSAPVQVLVIDHVERPSPN